MMTPRMSGALRPGVTGSDIAGWLEHVETEDGPSGGNVVENVVENLAGQDEDLEPDESDPLPDPELSYIASFKSRRHLMPH